MKNLAFIYLTKTGHIVNDDDHPVTIDSAWIGEIHDNKEVLVIGYSRLGMPRQTIQVGVWEFLEEALR